MNYTQSQILEFQKAYEIYNQDKDPREKLYEPIKETINKVIEVTEFSGYDEISVTDLVDFLEPYKGKFIKVEEYYYDDCPDGLIIKVYEHQLTSDEILLDDFLEGYAFWGFNASESFSSALKQEYMVLSNRFEEIQEEVQAFERIQNSILVKIKKEELVPAEEIIGLINKRSSLLNIFYNTNLT